MFQQPDVYNVDDIVMVLVTFPRPRGFRAWVIGVVTNRVRVDESDEYDVAYVLGDDPLKDVVEHVDITRIRHLSDFRLSTDVLALQVYSPLRKRWFDVVSNTYDPLHTEGDVRNGMIRQQDGRRVFVRRGEMLLYTVKYYFTTQVVTEQQVSASAFRLRLPYDDGIPSLGLMALMSSSDDGKPLPEDFALLGWTTTSPFPDKVKILVDILLSNTANDQQKQAAQDVLSLIFANPETRNACLSVMIGARRDSLLTYVLKNAPPERLMRGSLEIIKELVDASLTPLPNEHSEGVRLTLSETPKIAVRFLDYCNDDNMSALKLACEMNRDDIVQYLLQMGALLATGDRRVAGGTSLFTELHVASRLGHTAIVRMILEHVETLEDEDKPVLNIQMLTTFRIQNVPYVAYSGVDDNQTALYHACRQNHHEIVNILLRYASTHDDVMSPQRRVNGLVAMVEIQSSSEGTNVLETPLIVASRYGHLDVLRDLVSYAEDRYNRRLAQGNANTPTLRMFVNAPGNDDQRTALMYTVRHSHKQCAVFLAQNGARRDLNDGRGRNILHDAILSTDPYDMLQFVFNVLNPPPIPNAIINQLGFVDLPGRGFKAVTPLMLATFMNNTNVMDILFRQGANLIILADGNTVLTYAIDTQDETTVEWLLRYIQQRYTVQNQSVILNQRWTVNEKPNYTALMRALENPNIDIFNRLRAAGAMLYENWLSPALFVAVNKPTTEFLEVLLPPDPPRRIRDNIRTALATPNDIGRSVLVEVLDRQPDTAHVFLSRLLRAGSNPLVWSPAQVTDALGAAQYYRKVEMEKILKRSFEISMTGVWIRRVLMFLLTCLLPWACFLPLAFFMIRKTSTKKYPHPKGVLMIIAALGVWVIVIQVSLFFFLSS